MLRIDKIHSMDAYMSLLGTSTKIYIDNDRLDWALREACYTSDDFKALALLNLKIESSGSYHLLSPDNIIDFLYEVGVDLDKRFANKKTQKPSLDMKKVVDPLIESGIQVELLTAYKMHRSYKSYASFLRSLASTRKLHGQTSSGRCILEYDTTLQERENCRVYYKDIAVVSIPKLYSRIVTTPSDEYHIAWCDYPQADWRFAYNLFIKDSSNVEIMRGCDDAYEGLARIVEGEKFNSESFKESRKVYKVSCLSTFYNSQDKRAIPQAMREYFRSREKYGRYVYDLGLLQKFRLPVPITSYFGHTQLIPEASYADSFISKGLNTPIQTFTSHVVNETVFGILEKFWSLGYTKDDINIYFVRHDEPLFLFRDTILKDAWVFSDCSRIHIDGFTPIHLDFHFGNYYQEEDEYLTTEIKRNAERGKGNIQEYEMGEPKDYYPIPSVESVYAQYFIRPDKAIDVRYYDYRRDKFFTVGSSATDIEGALYETLTTAISKLGSPQYFLVYNDGATVELDRVDSKADGDNGTLLKVISRYDSRVVQMSMQEGY